MDNNIHIIGENLRKPNAKRQDKEFELTLQDLNIKNVR